jgi:sugar/nucleoside kinase (ribokinase family)
MRKLISMGAGLVALDVVFNGKNTKPTMLSAGGSCGNVMAILSFFGWKSKVVARLANDTAGEKLTDDLKNWNVDTTLITQTPDGSTPMFLHRVLKDKAGQPKHRFEVKDPADGSWLPSYKSILAVRVDDIPLGKNRLDVFYLDRATRGTIELARKCKEQNAIVFFEPQSTSDVRMFKECVGIADIVKFSADRIPTYDSLLKKQISTLEIRTMGAAGLEFSLKGNSKNRKWVHVSAFKLNSTILDAGGSGDWCSAAIIDQIVKQNRGPLAKVSKKTITTALQLGQAYGALNCCFLGARGLMNELSLQQAKGLVKRIQDNKPIPGFSLDCDKELNVTVRELLSQRGNA